MHGQLVKETESKLQQALFKVRFNQNEDVSPIRGSKVFVTWKQVLAPMQIGSLRSATAYLRRLTFGDVLLQRIQLAELATIVTRCSMHRMALASLLFLILLRTPRKITPYFEPF